MEHVSCDETVHVWYPGALYVRAARASATAATVVGAQRSQSRVLAPFVEPTVRPFSTGCDGQLRCVGCACVLMHFHPYTMSTAIYGEPWV